MYSSHNGAPSLVDTVAAGDYDGLAFSLVATPVYYNLTFSTLTQWSVEVNPAWTISGGISAPSALPSWYSYGQALGVGRDAFLPDFESTQCNATQPNTSMCDSRGWYVQRHITA